MPENQTQFNEEEPLYQGIYQPISNEVVVKQPFIKTKKGKILLVFGTLFLLLLIMLFLLRPRSKKPATVEPLPSPVGEVVNQTELERRIEALESELEMADPADAILPFPAVDMEIVLEEDRR